MRNLISVRLKTVLLLVQDRCTVCVKLTIHSEIAVRRTRRISYVTLVMWNVVSVHLETVLVSVQDRYTVCTKRTIGLEIILDAPDGTPR
jgi:K+-sensing histidine kinase KdpD